MFFELNKPDIQMNLDYSIQANFHQITILAILRNELPKYLKEFLNSEIIPQQDINIDYENYISQELSFFLNNKETKTGYLFQFQAEDPDIYARQKGSVIHGLNLLYIEAKRLNSSTKKDYVQTGIGRFKEEKHSNNHNIAVMLGYVQKNDFDHWFSKINGWIDDLIANNTINPKWLIQDKLKICTTSYPSEYESIHIRKTKEPIKLHHFWLDFSHN